MWKPQCPRCGVGGTLRGFRLRIRQPYSIRSIFCGTSPEIRVGSDLRFWAGLSTRLDDAIRRHEYLPAIFPEASPPKSGRKTRAKRKAQPIAFHTGWELTGESAGALVESFSSAIPGVGRALRTERPAVADADPCLHDAQGSGSPVCLGGTAAAYPIHAVSGFGPQAIPGSLPRAGPAGSGLALRSEREGQIRRCRRNRNRMAAMAPLARQDQPVRGRGG